MIVSFEHNYIFVKSRKTSGTSMEIALAGSCGPYDVITPLATEDELARAEMFPNSLPRNYCHNPDREEEYRNAIRNKDTKAMKVLRKQVEGGTQFTLYNHASVSRAKKFLEDKFFDQAYKFTIERHPYEKAVSMAWYRLGDRSFEAVLEEVVNRGKYRNYELYTIDGKVAVDSIIRYENFKEDVRAIEATLKGVDILAQYPSTKSGYRPDRKSAVETLSDEQKATVRRVCAEEFEVMGYAT